MRGLPLGEGGDSRGGVRYPLWFLRASSFCWVKGRLVFRIRPVSPAPIVHMSDGTGHSCPYKTVILVHALCQSECACTSRKGHEPAYAFFTCYSQYTWCLCCSCRSMARIQSIVMYDIVHYNFRLPEFWPDKTFRRGC